jgi:STE24 endopeptidase
MTLSLSSDAIVAIVVATLAFEYVLSLASSVLNYGALAASLPLEFEGVYDAEAYAKSQEYTRAKTAFGLCFRTFDLAVFVAFWLLFDGFERVDSVVQQLAPGLIVQGLLYLGIIVLGSSVLSLPWSVYSTFVLEERFGFNRTTCATFVKDRLKGLALLLLLGPPALAAVLWFFLRAGTNAWLYCWATLAALQLLMMLLAPVCLMPLFLKFTPLPDGDLKTAIEAYASTVQFACARTRARSRPRHACNCRLHAPTPPLTNHVFGLAHKCAARRTEGRI